MKTPDELSIVSRLQLARAYMAEHGFSPEFRNRECRCFLGALHDANPPWKDNQLERTKDFLRPHIRNELRCYVPTQSEFVPGVLQGVTTERALKVFDAAIA